jgi:hypothetical protein
MSEIETWDPVAGGNTQAPDDGWPEGMDRTKVNDCAREMMAAIRRWYQDTEWLQLYSGYTVTKDDYHVLRIAAVDATAEATAGRRVKLSGGGTVYGTIVSSTFSSPNTTVEIDIDPGLGREAFVTASLDFNDASPATIVNSVGSPWVGLVANDRVRVKDSDSNDGVYLVASESTVTLTLEAAETLTDELACLTASIYQEFGIIPTGTNQILFHHSRSQRESALRDVGTGAGQIPSMSHLDPHVLKREGMGQGIDADTVDGQHYTDIIES